jgi:hypothetical protein
MACSKCKQKNKLKEDFEKSQEFVSRGVAWFLIVLTSLAIYGLYSLINNFL